MATCRTSCYNLNRSNVIDSTAQFLYFQCHDFNFNLKLDYNALSSYANLNPNELHTARYFFDSSLSCLCFFWSAFSDCCVFFLGQRDNNNEKISSLSERYLQQPNVQASCSSLICSEVFLGITRNGKKVII